MNKSDIRLIFFLAIVIITLFLTMYKKDNNNKKALIYYEDKIVLTIDLSEKEKEYTVDGYNGKVKFLAGNGKIKVLSELSPLHLCSKQGYISSSYETIVCLPNKIIVEISNMDELDTIVK